MHQHTKVFENLVYIHNIRLEEKMELNELRVVLMWAYIMMREVM